MIGSIGDLVTLSGHQTVAPHRDFMNLIVKLRPVNAVPSIRFTNLVVKRRS